MYFVWILFLVLLVILVFLARIIVRHYIDPTESYPLVNATIVASFTISMFCITLIPIDVFVATQQRNFLDADLKVDKDFIRTIYIYGFSALLFISFVALPLAYFYGEEKSQEYQIDLEDQGIAEDSVRGSKFLRALKNTFFFLFLITFILLLGLVIRPEARKSLEHGIEVEWIKQLFDVEHVGEQAINFSLAIIISLGTVFWAFYGGYGLAVLPLNLVKGKKSLEQEKSELVTDLAKIRERYRQLQEKQARSHAKVSKMDQRQLAVLKKQERLLTAKSHRIDELAEESSQHLRRILRMITPFRVLIGVLGLTVTIAILWSLSLTTLDRLMHSKCGFACGFMVDKKVLFNPIDALLVHLSAYFPLDYILFFIITTYIFICVFFGIIHLGFNFMCLKEFELRKGTTLSQTLIIVSFIISISIMVLATQFITLAPQYTTFGDQKFKSGEMCSLQAIGVTSNFMCTMSNISSFTNKISLSFPLFAIISFFANIGFLFVNIMFLLYGFIKKRESHIEEEEEELLLIEDDSKKSGAK